MDRREAARVHVRRRAFERFGVVLDEDAAADAVERIQRGEEDGVEQPRGRMAYPLEIGDLDAVWIYDPELEWFVTVFSYGMVGKLPLKRAKKAARKNRQARKRARRVRSKETV